MIELLGLIGGGLLRLAPEVFKLWTAKADQAHEYKMTQLQLDIDKARAAQQIDLVHAQNAAAMDAAEMAGILESIKQQDAPSGVPFIDALSRSVRPVVTYYWVVGLYGTAKLVHVVVAFQSGAGLSAFSGILITEFDRTVVGSLLSYWFLDRSLRTAK